MKHPLLASALGFAALTSAQAAQAQQCVMPADAADTVMYLMPVAYDGALKSCKGTLAEDAFLPSADGRNYIEKFRTQQDTTWAGTYRFAQVMIAAQGDSEDNGMAETLGALDESQLRPFADALLGQMIAEEIKPDSCEKIDRGVELLSPLPAENVGGLVEFVLELVDLGDTVPLCNADGTVRVIPEGPLSEDEKAYDPAADEAGN